MIIMQEMDISAKKDFVEGEILAVDKPLGWTSFDVVKRLRGAVLRRLGVKRSRWDTPGRWILWLRG